MPLPSNPKRTGGPRTSTGKMAVAGNALQHGAYASQVVLPGENLAEFQALVDQFLHDFAPADVAESALVHQLAVVTWKRLRLNRVEHSALTVCLQREFSDFEVQDVQHLLPPGDEGVHLLNLVLHATPEVQADLVAEVTHARMLQEKASAYTGATDAPLPWSEADWATLAAQASHVAEWVAQWMHAHFPTQTDPNQWLGLRFKQPAGPHRLVLQKALDEFLQQHAGWAWLLDHPAKVRQALAQLQDGRLSHFWRNHQVGRLHDDLDRAFQRHLTELRRHQLWRRERATVSVTPEPADSANQTSSQ